MIKWLKKLAASKIQINIVIHEPSDPRFRATTESRTEQETLKIDRIKKSNFRFVSDVKTDHSGKVTEFHYTEEFKSDTWRFVSASGACDKNVAMALHLKIAQQGTIEPTVKKVVHWEGLDKKETELWVSMQLPMEKE